LVTSRKRVEGDAHHFGILHANALDVILEWSRMNDLLVTLEVKDNIQFPAFPPGNLRRRPAGPRFQLSFSSDLLLKKADYKAVCQRCERTVCIGWQPMRPHLASHIIAHQSNTHHIALYLTLSYQA
jgi:hypothetical protein